MNGSLMLDKHSSEIELKTGWRSTMIVWENTIKRYAIKKKDQVERIQDHLKKYWDSEKYFLDTYSDDPPVINDV